MLSKLSVRQADLLEVVDALGARAASRADCTAGKSSAIRTAMIAITTSNSISVKPVFLFVVVWTEAMFASPRKNLDQSSIIETNGHSWSHAGGSTTELEGRQSIGLWQDLDMQ